jgi:tRNA-splicing ligase RtcB
LNAGSAEGQAFLRDVDWALAYAAENRRQILDCMHRVIAERVRQNMEFADSFDVAHNTITREVHDGRELFIHRKGAMRASLGARGIVPGSMATASYLVEGLGNPESYASCSHGAGRVLTRTQAHERITVKQLRREMARVVYPEDLLIERTMVEESPSAYRDIKDVLAQQADLVRPLLRLEPVAVIKGG